METIYAKEIIKSFLLRKIFQDRYIINFISNYKKNSLINRRKNKFMLINPHVPSKFSKINFKLVHSNTDVLDYMYFKIFTICEKTNYVIILSKKIKNDLLEINFVGLDKNISKVIKSVHNFFLRLH